MTQENPELTCNACGTKTSNSQKFCGDCGERLGVASPPLSKLSLTPPEKIPIPPPGNGSGCRANLGAFLWIAALLLIGEIILSFTSPYEDPQDGRSAALTAEIETPEEKTVREAQEEADAVRVEAERHKLEAERAERETRLKAALSKLSDTHDEIQDITWYESPIVADSSPVRNSMLVYFGKTRSSYTKLRLKVRYTAKSWLFMNALTFRVNGERFDIEASSSDTGSDYTGGTIWEWYDAPVSAEQLAMLDKITRSEKTVMRIHGQQYYNDREITEDEKEAMEEVLSAYRDARPD